MLEEERPAPFFIAESTALDFLNSVAAPKSTEFDWLQTGSDLLDWLVKAGLARNEKLKHFRTRKMEAALSNTLKDVHAFRDAFRAFIVDIAGAPLTPTDHPMISEINTLLQSGVQRLQIESAASQSDAGQGGFKLVSQYELETPNDLLVRIAAACAELICHADFRYVRNCEGPTCTLYFLDVSKNHKRRWCSMEVCGNRAKAAAYRKR